MVCILHKKYKNYLSLLSHKSIRTKILQIVTICNSRLKPGVSKTQIKNAGLSDADGL